MIHPTAIIDKEAILGEDVEIGPYAVIEKGVHLGKDIYVGSHAHLKGDTTIGDNTFIGTGALIGEMPQILGMRQDLGRLSIGNNNIIREYVTIHSSSSPDKITSIGDNNYFMGFAHIAHDCHIRNGVVICNGALVAGHVEINDHAFISGDVVVHQFVRIGRLAMIGGLSRLNQDVPPFMLVVGDSKVWGLNLVGLKRKGLSVKEIVEIKSAFNILYRKKLPLHRAIEELKSISSERIKEIVDFIIASERGICGPHKSSFFERIFLDYPYLLFIKIPTYHTFLKLHHRAFKL